MLSFVVHAGMKALLRSNTRVYYAVEIVVFFTAIFPDTSTTFEK